MSKNDFIRSTCRLCPYGCGIRVYVKNGRVVEVKGDPENPLNRGKLCPKGRASIEYLYHPDRLIRPLRRLGERGGNKWAPVSWEEALDVVADGLIRTKENYGAEGVVFVRGSFKGSYQEEFLGRFANLFGSPNVVATSHLCFVPRKIASILTNGFFVFPHLEYPPQALLLWGVNLSETNHYAFDRVVKAVKRGTRVAVVDPGRTDAVAFADLWLKPRPGSDLALALGMLNVIVEEELYDRDFVRDWTIGFERLKEHVLGYPPEKVAEITWIPAGRIREAARIFSVNRPACIQCGNAIDQGVNSFQTARALCILMAVTGNLEIPGGELRFIDPSVVGRGAPTLSLPEKLPPEIRERRITTDKGLLPIYFSALPQCIMKAIRHGIPYPVKAAYIQGCNPLLTYNNSREVYESLLALDFIAVADLFMTPTAALADIVLPVGTYLEFDGVVVPSEFPIALVQQKVTSVGACRSDYEILRDLSTRLGFNDYFWDTEQQCLDSIMAPSGLSFDEFRKVGILSPSIPYRLYLKQGFPTPSGKVELYSPRLQEWGFDPLPTYYEPPETPFSRPELLNEYPLVMTTKKSAEYRHSEGRNIASLRRRHNEPVTFIHTQTAAMLGIRENDWVFIQTERGRIKQKAVLSSDIDPRVVMVDYGWWFPEEGPEELYGWSRSNVNILTDDQSPFNREMGSPNLRGLMCKVVKAPE